MICHKIKELLFDYTEGILDPRESAQVENHLKDCPACRAEHKSIRKFYDVLGSVNIPEPSDRLEEFLKSLKEQEVLSQEPIKLVEKPSKFKLPLGILAIAASVFIGIYVWYDVNRQGAYKQDGTEIVITRNGETEKGQKHDEAGEQKTDDKQGIAKSDAPETPEPKKGIAKLPPPVQPPAGEAGKKPLDSSSGYYELAYDLKFNPKLPATASIEGTSQPEIQKIIGSDGKIYYDQPDNTNEKVISYTSLQQIVIMEERINSLVKKEGGIIVGTEGDKNTHVIAQIPSENFADFLEGLNNIGDAKKIIGFDEIEAETEPSDPDKNKDGFVKLKIRLNVFKPEPKAE